MTSAAEIIPPELTITEGSDVHTIVLDKAGAITLGSDPSCDIRIDAESLAPIHATINVDDQGVMIANLSPDTYINKRQMIGMELVLWSVNLTFGSVQARLTVDIETSRTFVRNSNRAVQDVIRNFGTCGTCGVPHRPVVGGCPVNKTMELPSGTSINVAEYTAQFAEEVRLYGPLNV